MARPKGSTLSQEHRAALSEGKRLSNAVNNYLEALEANKPKRGRKRTEESIKKRLAEIDAEIAEATPLIRLQLVQQKMDLKSDLQGSKTVDMSALEAEFVKAAKKYSASKGISYAAWRTIGVSTDVLKKAGIAPRGGE